MAPSLLVTPYMPAMFGQFSSAKSRASCSTRSIASQRVTLSAPKRPPPVAMQVGNGPAEIGARLAGDRGRVSTDPRDGSCISTQVGNPQADSLMESAPRLLRGDTCHPPHAIVDLSICDFCRQWARGGDLPPPAYFSRSKIEIENWKRVISQLFREHRRWHSVLPPNR